MNFGSDVFTDCVQIPAPVEDGEPLVPPLVASTTFVREGVDSESEHQYSRVSNPTVAALERSLGKLEGGLPALAFASGLAAETALFLALLKSGDHVLCSQALYGGTTRLLEQVLGGMGVSSTFVDTTRTEEVRANLRPETRLVFLETPANPTLDLTDVEAVSALAREVGAWVAVDNTFLTGVLQKPLALGADVSVVSTTKFVEGHSAALGGALITRDEELRERFEFVRKCTGGIQSPWSAWLTLQGLKTLPLRLQRQSASAKRLAAWLTTRPEVRRVHYPSLAKGEAAELANRQHLGAHGAVLSFELDGGTRTLNEFLRTLRLPRLVEHVGSVETLITHSASMTHAGLTSAQREKVGVTDDLLRLSIGLEDVLALRSDLECALNAARVGESTVVTASEGKS